jgi:hypothetical protein
MEKSQTYLQITGPTGQCIQLSPPPIWNPTDLRKESIDYIEKFGTLTKLSKERDLFYNEKWQERHFVLSGSKLMYYGSASEKEPRGVIPLAKCYIAMKVKGEMRRRDAFQTSSHRTCFASITGTNLHDNEFDGVISRSSIAIHKPKGAMSTILSSNSSSLDEARTYYLTSDDDAELNEWCKAIEHNINASSTEKALQDFENYVARVSGTTDGYDFVGILNRLYSPY